MTTAFAFIIVAISFFIAGKMYGRAPFFKGKQLPSKTEPPKLGPYRDAYDVLVEEYEKENVKSRSLSIVSYQKINEQYTCPKCDMAWVDENMVDNKYCECDQYEFGHYHMSCRGIDKNKKEAGCHAKWIMKAKDES